MESTGHDVFLIYHHLDWLQVTQLACRLRERSVTPWLDTWDLAPGDLRIPKIEEAIRKAPAILVCIGKEGLVGLQALETWAALTQAMRSKSKRVVPVLLQGASETDQLPLFLQTYEPADLRKEYEQEIQRLLSAIRGIAPEPTVKGPIGICPYRGLESFDEEHSRFFFGRGKKLEELLEHLRQEARLLVVTGDSGSGKSSILRAGLIQAVRAGKINGSYRWLTISMEPKSRPCHELAVLLTRSLHQEELRIEPGETQAAEARSRRGIVETLGMIENDLRKNPDALSNHIDLALKSQPGKPRLLLVVDSFEQLHHKFFDKDGGKDLEEREAFLANLRDAASVVDGLVHVVIGVRSDFVPWGRGTFTGIKRREAFISDMQPEEIEEAITLPARFADARFSDGLVNTLKEAVHKEPGKLPLLQFALKQLWSNASNNELTFQAYAAMGEFKGAVTSYADDLLKKMKPAERDLAFAILGRLVQLGEKSDTDTRRTDTRSELESIKKDVARAVLIRLVDGRLLIARNDAQLFGEGTSGEVRIELAHEILIREWPQLKQWINDNREKLKLYEALRRRALSWSSDNNPKYLWDGSDLSDAQKLERSEQLAISKLERDFLASCRRAEEEAQRRERERQKELVDAHAREAQASKNEKQAKDNEETALNEVQKLRNQLEEVREQSARELAEKTEAHLGTQRKLTEAEALLLAQERELQERAEQEHFRVQARVQEELAKWTASLSARPNSTGSSEAPQRVTADITLGEKKVLEAEGELARRDEEHAQAARSRNDALRHAEDAESHHAAARQEASALRVEALHKSERVWAGEKQMVEIAEKIRTEASQARLATEEALDKEDKATSRAGTDSEKAEVQEQARLARQRVERARQEVEKLQIQQKTLRQQISADRKDSQDARTKAENATESEHKAANVAARARFEAGKAERQFNEIADLRLGAKQQLGEARRAVEDARRQAEAIRVDDARVREAESALVQEKQERKRTEQDLQDAIQERDEARQRLEAWNKAHTKTEKERDQAKMDHLDAIKTREGATQRLAEAKKVLKLAEEERQKAKQEREKAEKWLIEGNKAHSQAEQERRQAEKARGKAIHARADVTQRTTEANKDRLQAEQERQEAEQARDKAIQALAEAKQRADEVSKDRLQADQERRESEQIRLKADQALIKAQQQLDEANRLRTQAEKERASFAEELQQSREQRDLLGLKLHRVNTAHTYAVRDREQAQQELQAQREAWAQANAERALQHVEQIQAEEGEARSKFEQQPKELKQLREQEAREREQANQARERAQQERADARQQAGPKKDLRWRRPATPLGSVAVAACALFMFFIVWAVVGAPGSPRADFSKQTVQSPKSLPQVHVPSESKPPPAKHDPDSFVFSQDAGAVKQVVFSADGTRLLSITTDGSARVWRISTGEELAAWPVKADSKMAALLSPDGARVLIGPVEGKLLVRDVATHREMATLDTGNSPIRDVTFSPDGSRILIGFEDGQLRVWDSASREAETVESGKVSAAIFSPDGAQILTGFWDGVVALWDASKNPPRRTLGVHAGAVNLAAFSPNGQLVLTASTDRTVKVHDLTSRHSLCTLTGHEDSISTAVFSPNGQLVLTSSRDGTARLWDTAGQLIFVFPQYNRGASSAVFSPDGRWILTNSGDGARLWSAATGQKLTDLDGQPGRPIASRFSADGQWILWVSGDGALQRRKLAQYIPPANQIQDNSRIISATFSLDRTRVLNTRSDGTVRIWETMTSRALPRSAVGPQPLTGAFSPDGRQVLSPFTDGKLRIWDATTGEDLKDLSAYLGPATFVLYSTKGQRMLSATSDGNLYVWDSVTRRLVATLVGHTGRISSASFSPDGQRLVSASADNAARLWEPGKREPLLALLEHKGRVTVASFSSDGTQVLTASEDRTASIWDARTGKLRQVLAGHADAVSAAAFSPDGKLVLTGSRGGTARLWASDTGNSRAELKHHTGPILAVSFSPDGKYALTVSADKTACIWETADGKMLWSLTDPGGGPYDLEQGIFTAAFNSDGSQVIAQSEHGSLVLSSRQEWEVRNFQDSKDGLFSPPGP
jgi:WD40 repeat protein